jgi:predicted MPP superfamily phosphohydrolase
MRVRGPPALEIPAAAHAIMDGRRSGLKAWPILAILVIQVILCLGHWFVYSTWIAFWPGLAPVAATNLRTAMLVLAFSFVFASLLSFRFSNVAVRAFYWIAAVWLGFFNFFFWASFVVWIAWFALRLSHLAANRGAIRMPLAAAIYSVAALAGIYGLFNARVIRIRRGAVQIPNLPASWRGRRAVLLSDLHLGPINGVRFCRRLVALIAHFQPDVVFLPGDLFDGTKGDLDRLLAPFQALTPPFGIYFSSGNHEEFTVVTHYIEAIARAGIRVLANEQVMVDGLEIAGVLYHDSASPLRMKAALDSLRANSPRLDRSQPGILLNHAPTRLPIVEQAGFSLQLSGHTHGGQFIPFTWITRSVFGPFTSGLHRFGALQVYTSAGAGTWGPPMRVGTRPEIVYLTFE